VGVYGLDNEVNAYGAGELQVLCNPEVSYTVEPGDGQFFGWNAMHPTKRAAVGNLNLGYFLPYTLHQGATTNMEWGTGANAFTGVGIGQWQSHDFSAKFYDFSSLAPDTYTDQVVVTLTYF
jgi:spore coat protein U-like protein